MEVEPSCASFDELAVVREGGREGAEGEEEEREREMQKKKMGENADDNNREGVNKQTNTNKKREVTHTHTHTRADKMAPQGKRGRAKENAKRHEA